MTHSDFVDIRARENTDKDIMKTVETIYQIARHAQHEIAKLLDDVEVRFSFEDAELWYDGALCEVFYSLMDLFRLKLIYEPKCAYVQTPIHEESKRYNVEYASVKDKGWIHYKSFDTVEEAKACVTELIQETDGDDFTRDIRIVTLVDDNTAIFKKGLTVNQLIEWLQQIDPNKQIQSRDNTGDWCAEIQLSELMKFVYIQSLPE